jgi:tetratricopeptide (TPR) repeat protein
MLQPSAKPNRANVIRMGNRIDGYATSRVHALVQSASSQLSQRRYAQDVKGYLRGQKPARSTCGTNNLEILSILNGLGMACKYAGRFAQARRYDDRALVVASRVLNAGDSQFASLYHNLGGLEHALWRFGRAEPFARRAVRIRERSLGPQHPEMAADLVALAVILDGRRRYRRTEKAYHCALGIFRKAYEPSHREIAIHLGNLAANREAQGLNRAIWKALPTGIGDGLRAQ